ncbi:MAG: hypothetical protein DMD33_19520 [Gemmatimonadetes bacterium]|nr:MAG: hypothetical protein DMD33_19520 [Gemmatimonadota bacterium]
MGTFARGLRCIHCGAHYGLDAMWEGCPVCRREDFVYPLEVEYDESAQASAASRTLAEGAGGVWRFDPLLPVAAERKITLEEGRTPLVDCPSLADQAGVARLLVKDESRNPTWSHKDRAMAVGVSDALARGARAVTLSSSGNAGISAAAYAARAGIGCVIFVLDSAPLVARTVIQAYGGIVVATDIRRASPTRSASSSTGRLPTSSSCPRLEPRFCTPYTAALPTLGGSAGSTPCHAWLPPSRRLARPPSTRSNALSTTFRASPLVRRWLFR